MGFLLDISPCNAVEVTKKTYSDLLLEQKYFYNLEIKSYSLNYLYLSKGIVGRPDLSLCTLDEIKTNLCKLGVIDTQKNLLEKWWNNPNTYIQQLKTLYWNKNRIYNN